MEMATKSQVGYPIQSFSNHQRFIILLSDRRRNDFVPSKEFYGKHWLQITLGTLGLIGTGGTA